MRDSIVDARHPGEASSAEDTQEKVAIRRALRLGLFIWPAFSLLDVYMALVVFPGAPLGLFLLYRVVFELILIGFWRYAQRPELRTGGLRGLNRTMAYGAALFISLMALSLGGLTSPYMHGLSVVMLVMAVSIPTPWRLSLTWLIPTALMFPAVMAVAATMDPGVRAGWQNGRQLALAGAHFAFVLSCAAIGSICGHMVWLARRQVYEARRLGRYRLKAPIGRGAMNEVWLAWDGTLRRDVAIKILRSEDAEKRRTLEWFVREARTLSRLTSPHTVRVYDFGASDDGLTFFAMEYLLGADLQRVVRHGGTFTAARTVHIARQVCDSLAEAHDAGLVHRDIKPANIFLTQAGETLDFVKVVDFGMARLFEHGPDATQTMMIAGTPLYIAPELWHGRPADPRSDLYALGTTLYFLLAGEEPFRGCESLPDISRAHLERTPEPPSSRVARPIPASLERVVMRCLAKRPEERYGSIADLIAALDQCRDVPPWGAADAAREWAKAPVEGVLWGAEPGSDPSVAETLEIPGRARS